jgi:hypothetical protein
MAERLGAGARHDRKVEAACLPPTDIGANNLYKKLIT